MFNLVHLSPKTAKVTLVPTAENLTIDIDRVKSIYSKIGVTLDITWAAPFDITPYLSDGVLETKDVFGDLTDYSLSQQALINAYKATGKVANDTYYVFITNAKSSTGQGGYMALGGQFGFVFDQTERTLAHELGHGIFKLAHPFKKKQQGNVPSLMDYTSDEALLFADWKQINDPAFKIGVFQKQEQGEFAEHIWLTPDWKPFRFDKSHTVVNDGNDEKVPEGAIPSILFNGVAYFAEFSDEKFIGYRNSEGNYLTLNYPEVSNGTEIYLRRIGTQCGNYSCYSTTWEYIKNKKGTVDFTAKELIFKGYFRCKDTSNTEKNKCNGFRKIPEKEAIQTYQGEVTSFLQSALTGIASSRGMLIKPLSSFDHIRTTDQSRLPLSGLAPIEDKLHLLSHYTDVDMVVGVLPLENNSLIEGRVLSDMAKKAIKAQKGSRKLVYVLIASSDYESIFGVRAYSNDVCYGIGYAESEAGILSPQKPKEDSISKTLVSLFQGIEKPLYINRFYIKGDGSIINVKSTIEKVRDFKEIHYMQINESVYYSRIKAIEDQIRLEYQSVNFKENVDQSIDFGKIQQLRTEIERIKQEALLKEEDLKDTDIWKEKEIKDHNILREVYLCDPTISLAELQRLRSDFRFLKNTAIDYQMDNVLTPSLYYDFKGGDLVYMFADVVGMIPVIDIAGDIVGVLYATYRGDIERAAMYSVAIAIPVGAVYLKGIKNADNLFVIVAREQEGGELLIQAVRRNQRLRKDIELTSTLTSDAKEAEKALEGVRKYADLESIRNLAKAANAQQKLLKEGKFIDKLLEADYQKYLARKTKQGKAPKDRLEWKESRDYWLYDSPMARGNEFNKKAIDNDWYLYNEVTLGNGKRLDSYTPPMNGVEGKIVSRKATNLEEIELSTFEDYLKEIKAKYPIGAKINAPKYGDELKGKVLEGKHYLEIPESNKSFGKLQEYIDLAKNKYDIEIIFRAE